MRKREQIDNILFVQFTDVLKDSFGDNVSMPFFYKIMLALQGELVGELYRQLESQVLR
jgi:hypothetical protein